MSIARLENLVKIYSMPGTSIEVHALRGLNLSIEPGEYVAICGPSGSGKSTLMNIIGCLDHPTSGSYFLGEQDVAQLNDDQLSDVRGQQIGFVFQNFNLIPQLTVLENLEVPLFYQGVPRVERVKRATALADSVGLLDRGHHRPMELSGGQQQRVAIARALINDPLIILADEPTGNLDTLTGQTILETFDRLHERGKTIIIITHEPIVAIRSQRIVVLQDGLVVSDEPAAKSEIASVLG